MRYYDKSDTNSYEESNNMCDHMMTHEYILFIHLYTGIYGNSSLDKVDE